MSPSAIPMFRITSAGPTHTSGFGTNSIAEALSILIAEGVEFDAAIGMLRHTLTEVDLQPLGAVGEEISSPPYVRQNGTHITLRARGGALPDEGIAIDQYNALMARISATPAEIDAAKARPRSLRKAFALWWSVGTHRAEALAIARAFGIWLAIIVGGNLALALAHWAAK